MVKLFPLVYARVLALNVFVSVLVGGGVWYVCVSVVCIVEHGLKQDFRTVPRPRHTTPTLITIAHSMAFNIRRYLGRKRPLEDAVGSRL